VSSSGGGKRSVRGVYELVIQVRGKIDGRMRRGKGIDSWRCRLI
jgi:hypothetical protein